MVLIGPAIPEDEDWDNAVPDDNDDARAAPPGNACIAFLHKLQRLFRLCSSRASKVRSSRVSKFEQRAERDMLKFELGFIVVEAAALLIYAALAPGRAWPGGFSGDGLHLWPAGCVSIALRVAALPLRQLGAPAHTLAALLLIVDVLLVTSCHPNTSGVVWFDNQDPEPPTDEHLHIASDDVYSLTRHESKLVEELQLYRLETYQRHLDIYMEELRKLQNYREDEHTMVLYSLQILVWYMTTFVLLLRHAFVAVPICFLVVCSGSLGLWREDIDPERGAALELTLLAFSMTVAVFAKARLEKTQRAVFDLAEEKRSEAIKERVLRYAAEFQNEQGKSGIHPQQRQKVVGSGSPSVSALSAGKNSTSSTYHPLSVMSAPAAVRTGPMMNSTRRAGECLPPDAVVWVEGQGMPTEVEHIVPGQRVLCYDSLTMCPKYVEVLDAKSLHGQAPWVMVTLSDGTTLTLTADHPTQPVRQKQLPEPAYVPACDLRPDSDSLMVLKMLPVTVNSVVPAGNSGERRVALSLRQPDRHEVFASPSRSSPGQEFSTMAVGSADVLASSKAGERNREKGYGLTVKRTFIDFDNDNASYARSNSCPASLRMAGAEKQAGGSTRRKDAAGRVAWADDVEKHLKSSSNSHSGKTPRLQRTFSDSEITSITNTSMSSKQSSTPSDAEVLVAVGNADTAACVSELLAVSRSGLPSRGSTGHSQGQCQACIFENRWQLGEGQRCFKGALCERCHECHEPLGKKKRMSGAMRSYRKWQRSSNQGQLEEL